MGILVIQQSTADTPLEEAYVPASPAGDVFTNKGRERLRVQNNSGGPIDVTVVAQRNCNHGFLHDSGPHTVLDGDTPTIGPFDIGRFNDTSNRVHVECTGVVALAPPGVPNTAAPAGGGTWGADTAWVKNTYVNASGETLASVSHSQAVAAGARLQINSPAAAGVGPAAATGWYAYVGVGVAEPADADKHRQQPAGAPTAIGAMLVLADPPTVDGATPPAVAGAGNGSVLLAALG